MPRRVHNARFREAHGDKRIASIERRHVRADRRRGRDTERSAQPAHRDPAMMQFAIKAGIRTDDPTLGVKHAKIKTDGFRTWGEEDIAAFEAAHPLAPAHGQRSRSCLAPASAGATWCVWVAACPW
jgi:hypothetical protein